LDLADLPADQSITIGQLALAIEIRNGTLSIHGQPPDGLIAVGQNGEPLVFATATSQNLAPYCLAGWIADNGSLQLPLSAASLEVFSHLPVLR
jgi:hypothetical protein